MEHHSLNKAFTLQPEAWLTSETRLLFFAPKHHISPSAVVSTYVDATLNTIKCCLYKGQFPQMWAQKLHWSLKNLAQKDVGSGTWNEYRNLLFKYMALCFMVGLVWPWWASIFVWLLCKHECFKVPKMCWFVCIMAQCDRNKWNDI